MKSPSPPTFDENSRTGYNNRMKMKEYEFNVGNEDENRRLDVFISGRNDEITRSALKSREADITVNGIPRKLSYKVKSGETVRIFLLPPETINLVPQDVQFEILYSDEHIAVINKPAGIPVHPSRGHPDQTLVNGLLYRFGDQLSSENGSERPGIVHRLDMDTSGVMIIALSDRAHRKLSDDFKYHHIDKIYNAVVKGHPEPSGRIDLPIGRHPGDRKKMAVITDPGQSSKNAVTEWKVTEFLKDYALVKIFLHTGRTHQIRVHFSHIGHPVVGDPIYAKDSKRFQSYGLALVARRIEFGHPVSGKRMAFEVQLPDRMTRLIEHLR